MSFSEKLAEILLEVIARYEQERVGNFTPLGKSPLDVCRKIITEETTDEILRGMAFGT